MENQTKIKHEENLKITTRNYNDFVVSESGTLVNVNTGEIITSMITIIEHYHLTIKMGKQYSENYYLNNWKKGNKFVKLYQVPTREILSDLSVNVKALLLVLITLTEYTTNEILIDGLPPKNSELLKLCGYSERILSQSIKELISIGVINVRGGDKNRRMFMSPEYSFNGQNLLKSTKLLFE